MSMTNASMDAQTLAPGANGNPSGAFDPDIGVKTQDPTIASLKPSDGASWNHCDKLNDYGNTQEG